MKRQRPNVAWAAGFLLIQACGIHQATLINNAKAPGEVDLRKNGVLAFELARPEVARVECWARNRESGDKYQLDQEIDNGSSLRIGIGPLKFYEKDYPTVNEVPTVHLYELPPGEYTVKHFRIVGTAIDDSRAMTPKFETRSFRIEAGKVTYIGSHLVSGDWGKLGLGVGADFRIRTVDRFAVVDSVLGQSEAHGLREMPREKHLAPWDWKP